MGPIPNDRLKNLKDVDKWSSDESLSSSQVNVSNLRVRLYLYSKDVSNNSLSPVVHGYILLCIGPFHLKGWNCICTLHIKHEIMNHIWPL